MVSHTAKSAAHAPTEVVSHETLAGSGKVRSYFCCAVGANDCVILASRMACLRSSRTSTRSRHEDVSRSSRFGSDWEVTFTLASGIFQ